MRLIYVISGVLELSQRSLEDGKQIVVGIAYSHELLGGLALLTGEPTAITVKTARQTSVATISKDVFHQ